MAVKNKNHRKQGDAGMGIAIGWFASNGYCVCIPLTDSQKFDLVVEKDGKLKKVFVRTTTFNRRGYYECGLRVQGGNKTQFVSRLFDKSWADIVFIITGDGQKFLI